MPTTLQVRPGTRAISDQIPDARKAIDGWISSGVPGGIYQYSSTYNVVPVTGLDTTGVSDCSAAIMAALAGAPRYTKLLLPAGILRCNSSVGVSVYDVILAGTMIGTAIGTTLKFYGSAHLGMGTGGGEGDPWQFPAAPILGTPMRGDISFEVASPTGLDDVDGMLAQIAVNQPDVDPSPGGQMVVDVSGYNYRKTFICQIATTSGTTITMDEPLPFDIPPGSRLSRVNIAPGYLSYSGVEDLKVDVQNSSNSQAVSFSNCQYCWMKNVESWYTANYNFALGFNYKCTLTHCRGDSRSTGGTNGGALLMGMCGHCRVIDNIFVNNFPSIETNTGNYHNVYAYNFLAHSDGGGVLGCSFNSNHGAHNSFNLYEGNIIPRFQSDGYFGSQSDETLYRNWIHGTDPVLTAMRWCVTLNRLSRRFNLVGNQVGRRDGVYSGVTWEYQSSGGAAWNCDSSTSLVIASSGTKVFTVPAGMGFNGTDMLVFCYSAANPDNFMVGQLVSYVGTTLTLNIQRSGGAGTVSDWKLRGGTGLGGDQNYLYAFGLPNIGNGGFGDGRYKVAMPSQRLWWDCWDGVRMVRTNAYFNPANIYSKGNVVEAYMDGEAGNHILQCVAMNAAKNGTATWNTPVAYGADWGLISPNGFQALDLDVAESAILKANWNARDNAINSAESIGSDTLPDSLYLSEKPAFLGDRNWPVFDPVTPTQSLEANAAGYRYAHPDQEVPGYSEDDSEEPAVAMPVFSPPAGAYAMPMNVAMTCPTPDAEMRYTTDGSTPTPSSPLYSAPLTFTVATTLKAIGVKSGLPNSAVRTASYAMIAAVVIPPLRSARAPLYAIA